MILSQQEIDKQRAFLYENGLVAFSTIFTEVLKKHAVCKKDISEEVTNLNPEKIMIRPEAETQRCS